jgi:hypothetical protein
LDDFVCACPVRVISFIFIVSMHRLAAIITIALHAIETHCATPMSTPIPRGSAASLNDWDALVALLSLGTPVVYAIAAAGITCLISLILCCGCIYFRLSMHNRTRRDSMINTGDGRGFNGAPMALGITATPHPISMFTAQQQQTQTQNSITMNQFQQQQATYGTPTVF